MTMTEQELKPEYSATTDFVPAESFPEGPWLHRWCKALVWLIWPLVWLGGLVTTYDAGMSVPDWPGTYGYNLFLYPIESWISGPFDLFIEHGHRLLASVVGLVAIFACITAWRRRPNSAIAWLCSVILAMVIGQGVLGGLRVVYADRTLAMVHGCFAQATFAACVAAAVFSGRWWASIGTNPRDGFRDGLADSVRDGHGDSVHDGFGDGQGRATGLQENKDGSEESNVGEPSETGEPIEKQSKVRPAVTRFAVFLAGLLVLGAFMQVILGAMLRHAAIDLRPTQFAAVVGLHVAGAFVVWLGALIAWIYWRRFEIGIARLVGVKLVGLVAVQIALGGSTWAAKYGYTTLLGWFPGSEDFLIQSKGFVSSIIVTGHVATGSLIVAVTMWLFLRLWRLRWDQRSRQLQSTQMGQGELLSETNRRVEAALT